MKKKLGLIITIAVVSLIVVATIVLGVIKKDYSPSVQTNYQSVTVTNSSNSEFNITSGKLDEDEKFEKIVNHYDNAFKQSLLASLFSGNSSNDVTVVYSSGSIPSITGYKIVWTLNAEGEKIKLTNSTQTEYTVNKLTVGVEDGAGFKTITVYASVKDSNSNYHLKITTKANFEALYDYLEELKG